MSGNNKREPLVEGGEGVAVKMERTKGRVVAEVLINLLVPTFAQGIAYVLQPWEGAPSGVATICMLCFVMNWLAWIPAQLFQTEKFFDLMGSITYQSATGCSLLFSWYTHHALSTRQIVVSCFVMAWALRLGTFLFRRVLRDGKDGRFDAIKVDPLGFFGFWNGQGLWVFLCACGVFTLNSVLDAHPLGLSDFIGFGIFGLGFLTEILADWQKSAWREIPSNKGKWIDVGLWHYSRHPNYFGEVTLWTGVFVSCTGAFTRGGQWLSIIGPFFTLALLYKGSGIPMQESRSDMKWGANPEYWRYKLSTSAMAILPKFAASDAAIATAVEKAVAAGATDKSNAGSQAGTPVEPAAAGGV